MGSAADYDVMSESARVGRRPLDQTSSAVGHRRTYGSDHNKMITCDDSVTRECRKPTGGCPREAAAAEANLRSQMRLIDHHAGDDANCTHGLEVAVRCTNGDISKFEWGGMASSSTVFWVDRDRDTGVVCLNY